MVTPTEIVSGENIRFEYRDNGYSSVSVILRGSATKTLTLLLASGRWSIDVTETDNWSAGRCYFEAWATLPAGGKKLLERARFNVVGSIESAESGQDLRSIAARNVENLEAYLGSIGNPDSDQSVKRYRINNRELENYSINEILKLLDFWKSRLASEEREALGLPKRSSIKFYV
ncbi:MAG TPA: hypothetical protein VNQ90_02825 [Chthoniobacteraceae bacterium]|nr:hypothetical protein [Chthoniobacteraceae bacterium]